MKKVEHCPLCNYSSDNFVHQLIAKDFLLGTQYLTNITRCSNCNLYFANPLPSKGECAGFYPKAYSYYEPPLPKYKNWRGKVWDKLTYPIRDFIPRPKGDNATLLDVGAGTLTTLIRAKSLGYHAIGLDFSEYSVKNIQNHGFEVIHGDFEELEFEDRIYDIIIMRHVLEHFIDPFKALKKAFNTLRLGGKLIVTVPNIDSFAWRVFRQWWYALDAPRHLFWFTPTTVSLFGKKAGFNAVRIRYISFITQFTGSLSHYSKDTGNRSFLHMVQKNQKILLPILSIASYCLNLLKKGDIIEVVFQKPYK